MLTSAQVVETSVHLVSDNCLSQDYSGRLFPQTDYTVQTINPLRPNSDLSQTSHCNIKGLSVREVMRIKNMITQVKFY